MYATGQGTVKVRATHKIVESKKKKVIQIISVPYAVNKAELVERMSDLVYSGKLPLVEDVRDVSTEDIRIDLPLKKDADPNKVLAYLYKNTRLQNNFNVNMTCLVPTENPEPVEPERNSLALPAFSLGGDHTPFRKRAGRTRKAHSLARGFCQSL
jgi:DNA gyrase subunit A